MVKVDFTEEELAYLVELLPRSIEAVQNGRTWEQYKSSRKKLLLAWQETGTKKEMREQR